MTKSRVVAPPFRRSSKFIFLAVLTAAACGGGNSDATGNAGSGGTSGSPNPPMPTVMEGKCELADGANDPDQLLTIGCRKDFDTLGSEPLDATLPGARSVKVVLDQRDADKLHFINSRKYSIHYQFISKLLSGNGLPTVPPLSQFNMSEYYLPSRRFILAAVTYYEGANMFVVEFAPYDTASTEMMAKLFNAVKDKVYFGNALAFHPTSTNVENAAKNLDKSIRIATTDEIYAKIDYQPLNAGRAIGKLRFIDEKQVNANNTYLGFRDIVVLKAIPNDISVVAGMISGEFQTPLSHINVLAKNRKTPNMGLRNAWNNPDLRKLDGKWVELVVEPSKYAIKEVDQKSADDFWEQNKPKPVALPPADLSVKDLRDIQLCIDESNGTPLRKAIETSIKAFGAKAAGYAVLANTPGVPARKAFAIPAFYYMQFMEENGFFRRLDGFLADAKFREDPATRDAALAKFRDDMKAAPVNAEFQKLLKDKLEKNFPPGETMRFRTSTNAEDLDGFPCAGCYDSHTGDPKDWDGKLLVGIKKTYASAWSFRTFEERSYHSIDHKAVAMALLVHHDFPSEAANGVAFTANPFDESGLEPGFYVNVQSGGDAEVVAPPPGVTSDEFIYNFSFPGQPVTYLSHSSLVTAGNTVLDRDQLNELGTALDVIHKRFMPAYSNGSGWYAMDVEFKFDAAAPGEKAHLFVKQARPAPGTIK